MTAKILIIEDEPDIRDNLQDILETESFIVVTAKNGYEGVSKAVAELPNLILCDRMMREGDGTYVLQAIRDNPLTAQIPFIFVTALAAHKDIRDGMVKGADDYLTKPFTRHELLTTIFAQIDRAKSRAIDTKSKLAIVSESIRTHLNHVYGNLELYRADNPSVLENEEFADAWNSCLLAIAKIDKVIAALIPK